MRKISDGFERGMEAEASEEVIVESRPYTELCCGRWTVKGINNNRSKWLNNNISKLYILFKFSIVENFMF